MEGQALAPTKGGQQPVRKIKRVLDLSTPLLSNLQNQQHHTVSTEQISGRSQQHDQHQQQVSLTPMEKQSVAFGGQGGQHPIVRRTEKKVYQSQVATVVDNNPYYGPSPRILASSNNLQLVANTGKNSKVSHF